MRRRRTAQLLAAVLLAAPLTGCSGFVEPAGTSGAAAQATPTGTPATAPLVGTAPTGSFAVGVRQLRLNRGGDRPIPVTIWYPTSGDAGGGGPKRNARAANGRFPVVLFSHGLSGLPADYQRLLTRWAAAGFVVAAPTYPHTSRSATDYQVLDVINQPADASYVLDRLLVLDGRTDDLFHGHLATDRVAAAGHSAGGITTVGLFTIARDERLDAGVVLAGSGVGVGTSFTGPAAPLLFVHGQRDDVVAYSAGKAVYDAVPWPKALLTLPDGDHGQSMLRGGSALTVVTDTTVEFLRWSLYGDPKAKRRLPTDAARGGLAELDDQLG